MQVASYVVFDQYRPRNLLASALLLLLFGFATACCAEQGAVVNLSANAISATAAVDGVSTMSIRVAGPGDFWDEARTTSGRVEWTLPADAVDGFYRYDVYVSVEGVSAQEDEDRDLDEKEEAGGGRLLRQSGRFDVENGVISAPEPGQEEASAGSGAVVPELGGIVRQLVGGLLDFVFPAAHAADLNAHSVSPTVWYVAVVPGSPDPNLWKTRVTYDPLTSSSVFDTLELPSERKVIRLVGSKNNANSLLVDLNGDIRLADDAVIVDRSAKRLGINTITPTEELHIISSSPGIRLDDGGSGTWDIEEDANDLRFYNVADGVEHMTIKDGSGNVGIGAPVPDASLEVRRSNGTANILVTESSPTTAPRQLFSLKNNGPVSFGMHNTDTGDQWRFAAQTDSFRISLADSGGAELKLFPGGNLTIRGTLTQLSDKNAKTEVRSLNGKEVLDKLTALPVSSWAYKSDEAQRHIGPMAQDFYAAFGLGSDDKHIAPSDVAGVAMVGVQELSRTIEARDAEITELKQRLADLESLVNRLAKSRPQVYALNSQ